MHHPPTSNKSAGDTGTVPTEKLESSRRHQFPKLTASVERKKAESGIKRNETKIKSKDDRKAKKERDDHMVKVFDGEKIDDVSHENRNHDEDKTENHSEDRGIQMQLNICT